MNLLLNEFDDIQRSIEYLEAYYVANDRNRMRLFIVENTQKRILITENNEI